MGFIKKLGTDWISCQNKNRLDDTERTHASKQIHEEFGERLIGLHDRLMERHT